MFADGAWTFDLDEAAFPDGIEFKFLLAPDRWMTGPNLTLTHGELTGIHDYPESRSEP
ncbi:hypothetical protein ACQPYH_23055 [Kribbella sp. CA-245084]|uniref:hypothetical protein n=1 Tax=Kribbella sp. CA-245084 TaxID=3239940 RepID=UPI003D92F150